MLRLFVFACLFFSCTTRAAPAFDVDFKKIEALPVSPKEGIAFEKLRGKVVIIDFWAAWCTPCKDSFPHYNRLYKKYKDKGLIVIGVNEDDDPAERDAFLKSQPIDFYIYQDQNRKMLGTFQVQALPTLYVFDKKLKPATFFRGFGPEKPALLEEKIQELLKE